MIKSCGLKNRKNEQQTQETHHKGSRQMQESMTTKVPAPAKSRFNRNREEKQQNPSEPKASKIAQKHKNQTQQRSSNSRWQSLNLSPRRWQLVWHSSPKKMSQTRKRISFRYLGSKTKRTWAATRNLASRPRTSR